MIKIESVTLEKAYQEAASSLNCSITELKIEVVQIPSKGLFGLFRKNAIIVAVKESSNVVIPDQAIQVDETKLEVKEEKKQVQKVKDTKKAEPKKAKKTLQKEQIETRPEPTVLNDTIMPDSFVSTQDDDEDDYGDVSDYLADYEEEQDFCEDSEGENICEIVDEVKKDINALFEKICFKIDPIDVKAFDEETLLIEFAGEDAALLIGKEGYRYKALSYMLFNWINTKYSVNLRLEIAEFLKNQEDAVGKYLVGVCESIDRDGRAQTKILDGVLVQIALEKLRDKYPQKYIAIRSTRDGLKYIIINDYHAN